MPIRVVHGDVGNIGMLAAEAGRGAYGQMREQVQREDFWRRFQGEQQLVQQQRDYNLRQQEIQNRAFAMQTAAKNQPQAQSPIGPRIVTNQAASPTPEQIRFNTFNQQVQNMLKGGTIQTGQADEVMANFMAGSQSPFASLERGTPGRQADTTKSEISKIQAQRAALEVEMEQLESKIENDLPTSMQEGHKGELWKRIIETHQQEAEVYGRTGALGGSPGAGGEQIMVNPSTGQKIKLVNGQWVPIQ